MNVEPTKNAPSSRPPEYMELVASNLSQADVTFENEISISFGDDAKQDAFDSPPETLYEWEHEAPVMYSKNEKISFDFLDSNGT